jgi:uncharacterized protein
MAMPARLIGGMKGGGDMSDLFAALGLAMFIEGILYALFPEGMKRVVLQILSKPQSHLRTAGLAMAILGVGTVWLVRG